VDTKLMYTVGEAAERLGLGRTLVYRLVLRGTIKSVTVGRCRRVPAQALEAFVQERLAETDLRGISNGRQG
jgi:excisionase family DNA binding protein